MKLHLPSSLRKAVLACLAALALPAFSLSLGSGVLASSALVSLVLSAPASADFVPDVEGGWSDEVVDYNPENPSYEFTDENCTLRVTSPENAGANVYEPVGGLQVEGGNFKLILNKLNTQQYAGIRLDEAYINATNFWLTGDGVTDNGNDYRRARIESGTVLGKDIDNFYIDKVQLCFSTAAASYTGDSILNCTFYLGKGMKGSGMASGAFHNASIAINGATVDTNGGLVVMENTGIVVEENNSVFIVRGALSSVSSDQPLELTLRRYNRNATTNNYIAFLGGTKVDDANIQLMLQNNAELRLGAGQIYTFACLSTTENSTGNNVIARYGDSGTATLELKTVPFDTVFEGVTVKVNDFNYGNSTNYGLEIREGVDLRKTGAARFSFVNNFSIAGNVTVEDGVLEFSSNVENQISALNGNVTVTGSGSIRFAAEDATIGGSFSSIQMVQVETGKLTINGSGTVSLTNGISIGKDGKAATVEVNTTGAKNFGPITLGDNTQFVVKARAGWGNEGSSVISGGGTLVFDSMDLVWANHGDMQKMIRALFPNTRNSTAELKNLRLKNTRWELGSKDDLPYIPSIANLYVEKGSSLGLGRDDALNSKYSNGGVSRENTLYLAGTGVNDEGALYHFSTGVRYLYWNVVLEDHALYATGTTNGTFFSSYNGNTKTLTKKGSGSLSFGFDGHDGTFARQFDTVRDVNGKTASSGVFDIQEGSLYLWFSRSDHRNDDALENYGVKLRGQGTILQAGGTSQGINDSGTYSIAWLEGVGVVKSATSTRDFNLILTGGLDQANHDDSSISFEANGNARVNLTKRGDYSQTLGSFSGGAGSLNLEGGWLFITGDLNNASTVDNKVGDVTVSYTGGVMPWLTVYGNLNTDALTVNGTTMVNLEGSTNVIKGDLQMSDGAYVKVGSVGREDDTLRVEGNVTLSGGAALYLESELVVKGAQGIRVSGESRLMADRRITTKVLEMTEASHLELAKSWSNSELDVLLGGGSDISLVKPSAAGTGPSYDLVSCTLGTLRVMGDGTTGQLKWGDELWGGQVMKFTTLTGDGNLQVGDITEFFADTNHYCRVEFETVRDYAGLLTGDVHEGVLPQNRGSYGFFIGAVEQGTGLSGAVEVGGQGVLSDNFRKTGGGDFSINRLTITNGGHLYMNYSGGLSIGDNFDAISLSGAATLVYTNDDNYMMLQAASLLEGSLRITLNIDEIAVNVLQSGYYLGIVGNETDDNLASLKNLMSVGGGQLTSRDWTLEWREGKLYLVVTRVLEDQSLPWDANWGAKEYGNGPRDAELNNYCYSEEKAGEAGFINNALSMNGSAYDEVSRTLIKIEGGGGEWAAVLGGELFYGAAVANIQKDSYIYMEPTAEGTHYHLLVGGASAVNNTGDVTAGFIGTTHLQIEGGEVDYVVGGNHVTDAAFYFRGNSYVSVRGGQVHGGVVGGSVLTGAVGGNGLYSYQGNTYVFVYTLLDNSGHDARLPEISVGGAGKLGAGFGAVVGGNVWVQTEMASATSTAIFQGNSEITIDLSTYGKDPDTGRDLPAGSVPMNFQKAVVGGNYVLAAGGTGPRNDVYKEGHSRINITAGSDDIVFSGGVSGASRVQSLEDELAGASSTYHGTVAISLTGGTYTEKVVGGFWLEDAASGREAQLQGSTTLELWSGNYEADVVGGSFSAGSTGEVNMKGNSLVAVHGGSFTDGAVLGGSLATAFSGTSTHEGNSRVELLGGELSVSVMGGGRVQFNGGGAYTQVGDSSVLVGEGSVLQGSVGAIGGGSLSGNGGTYDQQGNSSVSVQGATVGEPDGSALVGGSYVAGDSLHVKAAESSLTVVDSQVTGTLVGGHYVASGSDNTVQLEQASVVVSGETTMVTGDIIGGSYMAVDAEVELVTPADSNDPVAPSYTVRIGSAGEAGPTIDGHIYGGSYFGDGDGQSVNGSTHSQGKILVDLQSGSMTGSVYAAGKLGDRADAETQETEVVLGEGFVFDTTNGDVVVSGGYESSNPTAGTVTTARLVVTSAVSALEDAKVNFMHFNEVNLADGKATIASTTGLEVMGGSFAKTGAGSLTIAHGLKAADGGTYTGVIEVRAGELLLGGDDQSLSGGLKFNLTGRVTNNNDNAYLQALEGTSLTAGNATAAAPINVDLVMDDGEMLMLGSYYLASGLDIDYDSDLFTTDETWLTEHLGDEDYEATLIVQGGKLYLRVREKISNKWVWSGEDSGVWDGTSDENWNVLNGDNGSDNADVYFTASGADANDGAVEINDTVRPSNVYVQGGSYVFTQGDGEGGLEISEGGALVVGGAGYDAELELKLANTHIDVVKLQESGVLTLSHEKAIITEGDHATRILFQGGMLAYGETDAGGVIQADLSSQVDYENSKNTAGELCKVRIRVGDTSEGNYGIAGVDEPAVGGPELGDVGPGMVARWGNADATRENNPGLKLALNVGLEKYGSGTLIVEWKETEAQPTISGTLAVYEGELQLVAHAEQEGSRVKMGADNLLVASGGTVVFSLQGVNSVMQISSVFTNVGGEGGTVQIGTADNEGLSFPAGDNAPYLLYGNNSQFSGRIRLVGGGSVTDHSVIDTVWVKDAESLGGKNTTLELAGRHVMLNNNTTSSVITSAAVEVYGVNYLGGYDAGMSSARNAGITLETGSLSGDGVLVAGAAVSSSQFFHHTISSGDLSGFTGTLVAMGQTGGSGTVMSSWTLTGQGVGGSGTFSAILAGDGLIVFDYAEDVVLRGGALGDVNQEGWGSRTSLENTGAGELVIAEQEENSQSTGSLITHDGAGAIRLGYKDALGTDAASALVDGFWRGSVLEGDGTLVLSSGKLINAIARKIGSSAKLNVETLTYYDADSRKNVGSVVDAGGTSGSLFNDIFVDAEGQLKNVSGDITLGSGLSSLHMRFGTGNVGTSASRDDRKNMVSTTGNIVVSDLGTAGDASLVLDFTDEALTYILGNGTRDISTYLYVLGGGGSLELSEDLWNQVVYQSGDYLRLLLYVGLTISGTDYGAIRLDGKVEDVYLMDGLHSEFPDTVKGYGQLDNFKATVVGEDQTLHFHLSGSATVENGATDAEVAAGGGIIHNLVGLEDSTLALHNDSDMPTDNRVTVVLDNSMAYSDLEPTEANGLDTTFKGTIVADAGVDLMKTGSGTLSIGSAESGQGGLQTDGDLRLMQGSVVIQGGSKNRVGLLVFDYTTDAAADEDRGLRLTNGSSTTIKGISELSDAAYRNSDNLIGIDQEAELKLSGISFNLKSTRFVGTDGTGVLTVDYDSMLSLITSDDAQQLSNVRLNMLTGSTVDLRNTTQNEVSGLSGKNGSKLMGYEDSVLTVTGNRGDVFSGELAGDGLGMGKGGGTLRVASTGALVLKDVNTSQSSAWNLDNQGDLTIDVSGLRQSAYFQDITLGQGSSTTYILNTDYSGSTFYADSISVGNQAKLTIESTGQGELNINADGYVTLATVDKLSSEDLKKLEVQLRGVAFLHYDADGLRSRDHKLQLKVREVSDNRFLLPDMEHNAAEGANLFWAASGPSSEAWIRMLSNKGSDLYAMEMALANMYYDGQKTALSEALAAGAGASYSVMGGALARDVQRQLTTIRNRTTTMPGEPEYEVYDDSEQIYHVWLNAETSNFRTNADGLAPGYSLNSWGGTVGLDTEISKDTTVGLAISAMYGDLKPNAADHATGNLDTTYLTAFARVANGAWLHTFVVAAGMADAEMSRTVTHSLGSYKTHGSTSGFALGALYEVGYARVMNAEGTFILQSVFNAQVTHAALSGFSETGSDAGLEVEDISHTMVTFGFGARVQSIVGENAYNRTSIFEARLLAKIDAGDRASTASNSLINGAAGVNANMKSAEVGVVGLEMGAGLTIPLGASSGSVFVDASAELRRGYTGVDASVGYRFSF